MKIRAYLFASALLATVSTLAMAQTAAPPTPPIAAPQNVAYGGEMRVHADMTDIDRRIIRVTQTVPVSKAGDLVLLMPKWLPGKHHPHQQNIIRLAGLKVTSGGKNIGWTRDVVDMYAFHINVPKGAKSVELSFEYLAPTTANAGRTVITSEMANLEWEFASLYPAGYYASKIPVKVSVKLPEGWQAGTALEVESTSADNTITYKSTDYETLIDSPMFAGKYFKRVLLSEDGKPPVYLNAVADKEEWLNISDEALAAHKKLVVQADRLYGVHHYNHYDFLVAATDKLGGIGLEHHRSSENSVDSKHFTDWKAAYAGRDLLPHEYTHSWNGKFKRPDDLWTPNYQVPMRDSLLWVYEGQTEYWGTVLAARSGFYTKEQTLDYLATVAAFYENLPGHSWRPLQDTTNDPIIAGRAAKNWSSYQLSENYYEEGALIWFDVDTLIREKTGGKKSLDDFAKLFFGGTEGDWTVNTYNFDTVVNTLIAVYPYDWATFLRTRLDQKEGPRLGGIERGGYRLVFTDTPNSYTKMVETARSATTFDYSIGFSLSKDNTISSVWWNGPAFKAGLAPGVTVVAVNGKAASGEAVKTAIKDAKATQKPVELIIKSDDNYKTVSIPYFDGLRYPKLERIEGKPALLDDILAEKP